MKKLVKILILLCFFSSLVSCASHPHKGSDTLTKESFEKESRSKGIILMDVNWYMAGNCGGYERAGLRGFGFDLLPLKHLNDKDAPDLVINMPIRFPFFQHRSRGYENYAFLIKPGKYVLSKTRIFVVVGNRVMYSRETRRSNLIPTRIAVAARRHYFVPLSALPHPFVVVYPVDRSSLSVPRLTARPTQADAFRRQQPTAG